MVNASENLPCVVVVYASWSLVTNWDNPIARLGSTYLSPLVLISSTLRRSGTESESRPEFAGKNALEAAKEARNISFNGAKLTIPS